MAKPLQVIMMVLLMNFSQLLKEMEHNVATKVLASVLLHRLASNNGYARPPQGVPADMLSAVKKCPNLFMLWGFAIPSNQAVASISMG